MQDAKSIRSRYAQYQVSMHETSNYRVKEIKEIKEEIKEIIGQAEQKCTLHSPILQSTFADLARKEATFCLPLHWQRSQTRVHQRWEKRWKPIERQICAYETYKIIFFAGIACVYVLSFVTCFPPKGQGVCSLNLTQLHIHTCICKSAHTVSAPFLVSWHTLCSINPLALRQRKSTQGSPAILFIHSVLMLTWGAHIICSALVMHQRCKLHLALVKGHPMLESQTQCVTHAVLVCVSCTQY